MRLQAALNLIVVVDVVLRKLVVERNPLTVDACIRGE
jgi:hypothetical protein